MQSAVHSFPELFKGPNSWDGRLIACELFCGLNFLSWMIYCFLKSYRELDDDREYDRN